MKRHCEAPWRRLRGPHHGYITARQATATGYRNPIFTSPEVHRTVFCVGRLTATDTAREIGRTR